jgi:Demethylmenaquinone methyltransferase
VSTPSADFNDSLDHRRRELLRTALLADVLDAMRRPGRCLGWDIVPLVPGMRLVGRAYTMSCERVSEPPEAPYQGLLRALDKVGPDDVLLIPANRANDVAVWGELVSHACRMRGAAGMVTDGLIRDAPQIRDLGFPVFARGTIPYDVNGRLEITGVGSTVAIDGVEIEHRSLVVGDDDGVVAVPPDLEAEAVAAALHKAQAESRFRDAVIAGELPSVAYERYGVL